MAKGRRRRYSASYRKRVENSLGMTIEEAKRRGISLQKARGHVPREKALLEQRRAKKGQLSDPERAFLKRQLKKTKEGREYEPGGFDAYRAKALRYLERLSPSQRAQLIHSQSGLARSYKARQSIARRQRRSRATSDHPGGGGGLMGGFGGYGSRATSDHPGGGGGLMGGFGGYDFGTGREEFDDWAEDDFPDFDDDMDFLLYYH